MFSSLEANNSHLGCWNNTPAPKEEIGWIESATFGTEILVIVLLFFFLSSKFPLIIQIFKCHVSKHRWEDFS